MIKILKILVTILITSFYFFPVDFIFLPTNTKNLLGALGLVFAIIILIRQREFSVPRELIFLLLISCMVSIMSMVSVAINQTPDMTYATYIRSAVIWLSGAFSVCCVIKMMHGRIDIPLMVNYLIGACLFQCASAMLIQFVPAFQGFVDHYVQQGQALLREMGRIYGIGASLDVAGSRFAAVLVATAFMLASSPKRISIGMSMFYTLSFVVITVIGNMISRTTILGTATGLAWIVLAPFIIPASYRERDPKLAGKWMAVISTLAALIVVSVVVYNSFPAVQELFRFGFEGFFSWVETGEWQTDSTSKLQSMIVWPEELRTWIIGDGYFENSRNDPNYLGDSTDRGFYMGTDIGYLRFIFYFGILGLFWIIAVVVYSAYVCAKYNKAYAWLFVMALGIGLLVWAKVSTDIFLFFCLFLCTTALQDTSIQSKEITSTPNIAETP